MSHNEHKEHEHGHSGHEHDKVYHIVVNLEPKEVREEKLTFDEICRIAFPQGPFGDSIRYTVTCSKRGADISMVKGDSIEVENGMICHVSNTDRS